MKMVELFLPLYDRAGKEISGKAFAETRRALLTRFGDLTSYSQNALDSSKQPKANGLISYAHAALAAPAQGRLSH